jgi:hypothetical protein
MLSAIPSEAISRNAVQVSKEGASATDFIGKRAETSDHPLAFLVNGPPAFVIPAHFHEIDQYQIFVGGSATLGKHTVLPGSVHYADAYTHIEPGQPHETACEILFEEPDGIASYRLSAGPDAILPQPDVDHGGAYYVVLEGEIIADGDTYPPRSCIWVGQHEHPPEMIAGMDGASVAFMSFARRAD